MTMTPFGKLLADLIDERCRTLAKFCELVEDTGHHVDRSMISRILVGERRPPLEQLESWCHVLGLSGKDAKSFRFEAGLTHTPDDIVEWIRQQASRESRMSKLVDRLQAQLEAEISRRLHAPSGPGNPPSSR